MTRVIQIGHQLRERESARLGAWSLGIEANRRKAPPPPYLRDVRVRTGRVTLPTDLEPSTDDEHEQQQDSPVIKDLRKRADQADANETRAVAAERKLALHEAGLGGLNQTQMKAFLGAHEGDWDADALKATAKELGFGQSPSNGEQTDDPQIPAEELDAHQRVAAAAGGEPAPPSPDLTAAIQAAKDPEEIKTILRNAGRLAEPD